MVVLLGLPSLAAAQTPDEHDVKAAFLVNLAKFVDWPAAVSARPELAICILGDDPFGLNVDRLAEGLVVRGRRVVIRRIGVAVEAAGCDIAFVRSEEHGKAVELIAAVRGLPVLTVGEDFAFAQLGGAIHLPTRNRRVEIVVNTSVVEASGLRLSSKLMSLATILP